MATQLQETTPSLREKNASEEIIDEKQQYSAENFEGKPTHLNEFDTEGVNPEEQEVLLNDGNPFPPMPNAIEETTQLTVRAVAVGSMLGLIVGASNVYLGLKTGELLSTFNPS
jgi:hypothetical protein